MTTALYLRDCYLQRCEAKIIEITDEGIVLDQTVFYPTGGGQPYDTGKLIFDEKEFIVTNVTKKEGHILHHISGEKPSVGTRVICAVDWERRYKLMRHHTAAHLLSGLINKETGAAITGNQLDVGESRIDFDLEAFDKEAFMAFANKANTITSANRPVTISFLSPEQAKHLSKLAVSDYSSLQELRIVDIDGIDTQPCGGTHVKNTKEIGKITITQLKNKGKNNRRLYYSVA